MWRRASSNRGKPRGWRRWGGVALLGWLSLAAPAGAREVYGLSESALGLYLGNSLLAAWQVPEARRVLDGVLAADPDNREARAAEAQVLFFEGRYPEAVARLTELAITGPFAELARATAEATADFRDRSSTHFRISWGNPRDELLVDPALEALEAARGALAQELGFAPDQPVRVEVYPSVADFTAVSTLTRGEVETSGTIGLCKFDRLMITSPRATLWGYRWRDTLCHEYVHLALYRLTGGSAPIWVHEGIAKYLEGSWRGAAGELDPSSRGLLARRLAAGTLISLEEMSPSVAKLPSAEDTALAFAEVGTMMAFLVQERGTGSLRALVEAMGDGMDDRQALEAVWGDGFATFDAAWREWVAAQDWPSDAHQVIGLELADRGDPEREPGDIPDPGARDFARLGDLLRGRGRQAAAAEEYGKAYARAPEAPGIASRWALGLLWGGAFASALEVADAALEIYPDLAVLWYRKGEAALGLGRPDEARQALREVLEINPFHAPARAALQVAAREMGDLAAAQEQERALLLLEGPAGTGHPAPH